MKGQCKKSHDECNFVHNPTCWFFANTNNCKKGDNCLFPHRGEKGVLIVAGSKAAAPAQDLQSPPATDGRPGGPAAADSSSANGAKAKAKAGAKKQAVAKPAIAPESEE